MLTSLPNVFMEGKFNKDYFVALDSYIKDRFGLRSTLIKINHILLDRSLISSSGKVLYGKDGFLFLVNRRAGDNLKDFCKANLYSKEELETLIEGFEKRAAWCKDRGIKFLVIIAPNKHNIYSEYYPLKHPEGITRTEQLMQALEGRELNVIYLAPAILKAKKDFSMPLYYKTDTHWNMAGAMVGAREIMDRIRGLFPDIKFPNFSYDISYKEIVGRGDLVRQIGLTSYKKDFKVEVTPNVGKWEDYYTLKQLKDSDTEAFETTSKDKNLPNALVYGDSFFINLTPFMAVEFSSIKYFKKLFTKEEKDLIGKESPDLVIYEYIERQGSEVLDNIDF